MSFSVPVSRRRFDLFEWIATHEGIVDAAVATVMALCVGLLTMISGGTWAWWTLGMIACSAFLRTHTEIATAALGCLAMAHFAMGPVFVLGDIYLFSAVYFCVVRARRFTRRLAIIAALMGALLSSTYLTLQILNSLGMNSVVALIAGSAAFISTSIAIIALWAFGRYQRVKVTQLAMAQDRAQQAEREREQLAQLAVAAERSRIAREMHDVIAHSLSVIIAQADGGRYLPSESNEASEKVFSTIASTGRSALTDMRSLLGVLRNDDGASRAPQPGIAQLSSVVESFRSSGLSITLTSPIPEPPVSSLLDLTMLRVVQEALTNVLKHAGSTSTVTLSVLHSHGRWDVHVHNTRLVSDHPQEPIPSAGQGLRGMRERVRAVGGTLQANHEPDGGFSVVASFPDPDYLSPTKGSS